MISCYSISFCAHENIQNITSVHVNDITTAMFILHFFFPNNKHWYVPRDIFIRIENLIVYAHIIYI